MPVIVATFGKPEDITNPGFDGKVFRFPVALIDRDDLGTARQPSKTKSARIRGEVSGSRIGTWGLADTDLVKVVFEIAKEHLIATLNAGAWTNSDLEVTVNAYTHKGPCPFDPTLIQEPTGAVVEIEVKRPIGFIWEPSPLPSVNPRRNSVMFFNRRKRYNGDVATLLPAFGIDMEEAGVFKLLNVLDIAWDSEIQRI